MSCPSPTGDESEGQPLRHAHGRVGGWAEPKVVAGDRHGELGAGPLGDQTLQDLAQQRLFAGLDANVAADWEKLAAEWRLDREGPAVDRERGRLKRPLRAPPAARARA